MLPEMRVNMEAFLYQYLVGGFIFLSGIFLAWRSGDYSWKRREDRFTTLTLAALFLFYFSGHLAWLFLAGGGG